MRGERTGSVTVWVIALLGTCCAISCHEHTPAGNDARADAAPDADSDADLDEDADRVTTDGDADADNPCLPDPDGDADNDTDTDIDADVDADSDADGDADGDADIEGEADSDLDEDVDLDPCPDDMVPVGRVCIDIWEASRDDATATSQGVETALARSRPGVIPWHVNPMTVELLAEFAAACEAAGKRLCTPEEWGEACTGPAGATYVFGDTFDRETCNCVDTFCDDHCAENGIPDTECVMSDNCGYTYSCFLVVPTGDFPGCTNEIGTFDINGNVWEVVPSTVDPRGYEVRGGAFNCASAATRLQCTFNAGWDALYAGFRCCRDR